MTSILSTIIVGLAVLGLAALAVRTIRKATEGKILYGLWRKLRRLFRLRRLSVQRVEFSSSEKVRKMK